MTEQPFEAPGQNPTIAFEIPSDAFAHGDGPKGKGHHGGGSSSDAPDLATIVQVLGWAMKTGQLPAGFLDDPGIKRGVVITINVPRVAITIGPLPGKLS